MSEPAAGSNRVLIIGYGNPIRGDDGLGPFVAGALAELHLPAVDIVSCHQLLPELAESLAQVEQAIFVDAVLGPAAEGVKVIPLEDRGSQSWSSHLSAPECLLTLTRAVHGRCPRAWWVTVPGQEAGFEERLSARGQEQAHNAIRTILSLLAEGAATGRIRHRHGGAGGAGRRSWSPRQ